MLESDVFYLLNFTIRTIFRLFLVKNTRRDSKWRCAISESLDQNYWQYLTKTKTILAALPKPFPPSIISWPRFVPIAWQIKIFDECQNWNRIPEHICSPDFFACDVWDFARWLSIFLNQSRTLFATHKAPKRTSGTTSSNGRSIPVFPWFVPFCPKNHPHLMSPRMFICKG